MIAVLSAVLLVEGAFTYQRNRAVGLARSTSGKTQSQSRPGKSGRDSNWPLLTIKLASCSDCRRTVPKSRRAGTVRRTICCSTGRWPMTAPGDSSSALRSCNRPRRACRTRTCTRKSGMEYGKMGKYPEALDALATAEKTGIRASRMTYYYLGQYLQAIQGNRGAGASKTTGTCWRWIPATHPRASFGPHGRVR